MWAANEERKKPKRLPRLLLAPRKYSFDNKKINCDFQSIVCLLYVSPALLWFVQQFFLVNASPRATFNSMEWAAIKMSSVGRNKSILEILLQFQLRQSISSLLFFAPSENVRGSHAQVKDFFFSFEQMEMKRRKVGKIDKTHHPDILFRSVLRSCLAMMMSHVCAS